MAQIYTEVWTGELVKKLREFRDGGWLNGISDQSSVVNNDVIHLVDVGVDPEVLINNTDYPLDVKELKDGDIPLKLDKFQTQPTSITDDELYAASYDKMARVIESHKDALGDAEYAQAAYNFCAAKNSKATPVLTTSGDAEESGRKRLTVKDVVNMKAALDKLGVPVTNRRLVLCPDHVNDLLLADQNFANQFGIDDKTGFIKKQYGFDIYTYALTPVYSATGEKQAVGTETGDGVYNCSFAFYTPRAFKATGSAKTYLSTAENDPIYQRNLIAFRQYFLAMPKKADAGVVIRSVKA